MSPIDTLAGHTSRLLFATEPKVKPLSRGRCRPQGADLPQEKRWRGERDSLREGSGSSGRQIWRSTIMLLMCEMAFAGLRPLGQALAQFMIVWQR